MRQCRGKDLSKIRTLEPEEDANLAHQPLIAESRMTLPSICDGFDEHPRKGERTMQATRRTCVVSAGLHLALAFLTSVACNAETGERKATAGALAGRVVDSTGEPVSGATVWLVGGPYDHDAKALMKTVADAQGRFVLRNSKEYIRPNWPVPHVVARDSRGRLGGDVFPWAWPRWTPRQNLRVQLQEVREYRGRVEDAAGKPIANARVRL